MHDGAPAYVTAVSRSDMINGWRDRRHEGGVADRRPRRPDRHRPAVDAAQPAGRAADGVYLLDSGRGMLARVDPKSGARTDIAFCPGFLRGLALVGGYAIATVSLPRDGAFSGLALQDELKKRDGEPWCGVCIVDLRTGDLVEWIRLNGAIKELFDVAVIPEVLCPMALGVNSPDIQSLISFEPEFGALEAPAALVQPEIAEPGDADLAAVGGEADHAEARQRPEGWRWASEEIGRFEDPAEAGEPLVRDWPRDQASSSAARLEQHRDRRHGRGGIRDRPSRAASPGARAPAANTPRAGGDDADHPAVPIGGDDQFLGALLGRHVGGQIAEPPPEGDRIRLDLGIVDAARPGAARCPGGGPAGTARQRRALAAGSS